MADNIKSEDFAYRNDLEVIEEGLLRKRHWLHSTEGRYASAGLMAFVFGGLYVSQIDLYTDRPRWVRDHVRATLMKSVTPRPASSAESVVTTSFNNPNGHASTWSLHVRLRVSLKNQSQSR